MHQLRLNSNTSLAKGPRGSTPLQRLRSPPSHSQGTSPQGPGTSQDLMAASKRGESPSYRTRGDRHFPIALLLAPFPVNTPFGVASTFLFNAKIKIKTRKQTKQNRTFTSNPTPFFTNRSQNLAHSQSCQQKIRFYFQNLQKKKKGKSGREEPGDQIGGPASSERGEEFRMVFEGWEETDPRES